MPFSGLGFHLVSCKEIQTRVMLFTGLGLHVVWFEGIQTRVLYYSTYHSANHSKGGWIRSGRTGRPDAWLTNQLQIHYLTLNGKIPLGENHKRF